MVGPAHRCSTEGTSGPSSNHAHFSGNHHTASADHPTNMNAMSLQSISSSFSLVLSSTADEHGQPLTTWISPKGDRFCIHFLAVPDVWQTHITTKQPPDFPDAFAGIDHYPVCLPQSRPRDASLLGLCVPLRDNRPFGQLGGPYRTYHGRWTWTPICSSSTSTSAPKSNMLPLQALCRAPRQSAAQLGECSVHSAATAD